MCMKKFKEHWEIKENWQLFFPFLGVILLLYSCYKLASLFFDRHISSEIIYIVILTIVFYILLLKLTLWLFKKLEKRWKVQYKWEIIRIFIVFAVTGTSSMFVGKPLIKLIGITKENLNVFVYWVLYIIITLIFYKILLLIFGWIFGQFNFFRDFVKKMLGRFGLKQFFN